MQEIIESPSIPSGLKSHDESSSQSSKIKSEEDDNNQIDLSFKPEPESEKNVFSIEDSSRFLENLFEGRNLILNENWDFSETIHSKVTNITEEVVELECLIDRKNSIIEQRRFPKILFEGLKKLEPSALIILKTKMKKGTYKLEVFAGDLIVKNESFDINDDWASLKNKGLDNKLTEW
jgi:hypothetical protein